MAIPMPVAAATSRYLPTAPAEVLLEEVAFLEVVDLLEVAIFPEEVIFPEVAMDQVAGTPLVVAPEGTKLS